jgi:hypothetical protein
MKLECRRILGVALVVLAMTASGGLTAMQTENYELFALPAPKPLIIDGDLSDWNLASDILVCYDQETLLDTNSARVAAMYDENYFYISARFKDKTPMINHVDPIAEAGCGWRSDCVQLRLWADPEKPIGKNGARITHIDGYYFTDKKIPASFVTFHDIAKGEKGFEGKIENAVGRGVDLAFRKDTDGGGYTQEMRISWKLLRRDGRPYREGEVLRMGIELLWGDATGKRWPSHRYADLVNRQRPSREFFWSNNDAWGEVRFVNTAPAKMATESSRARLETLRYRTEGPVAISYDLPLRSYVTLVVEKTDGTRVRNLTGEWPRPTGRNTDFWDGADDSGRLVPPGDYRVRGLFHEGFDVLYKFSYGNPGTPAWETSDLTGAWLTDHAKPSFLTSDEKRIYLAAPFSEGGSTVIALDYDGRKLWGTGRIPGGMMVRYGRYLYMLASGFYREYPNNVPGEVWLQRIDPETGRFAPFSDGESKHLIDKFDFKRKIKSRLTMGAAVAAKAYDAEWLQSETLGLAAVGKKLYVSMYHEGKIIEIDPEEGKKIGEFAVVDPLGLAVDSQDNLLAISGRTVVRISAEKTITPVVASGLSAPVGLATDGNDNIYVSDWAEAMCVKVFSPQGKLVRVAGKEGGRALRGAYDPNGMFMPLGITVDKRGRLWTAEHDNTPRRLSVWDESGKFAKEFCGTTWYAGTENNVNPYNPSQAFSMGNILYLDWKAGQWRVAGTLWRPTHSDEHFGPLGEGMFHEVIKYQGRTLLASSCSYGYLCISELTKDGARPLTAVGNVNDMYLLRESGEDTPWPDIVVNNIFQSPEMLDWAKKKYPELFGGRVTWLRHRSSYGMEREARQKGKPMRSQYLWMDENGDGRVQEKEIRFYTPEELGFVFTCHWRFAYAPDLTLYPAYEQDGSYQAFRLPLKGWTECGAPIYDPRDAKRIYKEKLNSFIGGTWADAKGNLLLNFSPLTMLSPAGQTLWTYPNKWPNVHGSHSAPKDDRGLIIGPLKVIGSADLGKDTGEVFCLNGNMGRAFMFTTDGLYLGGLFKDCRAAPDVVPADADSGLSIMNTSCGSEWFGGEFFKNADDGKIYIGSDQAREAVLLSEVRGLDKVRRLPVMPVEFTKADYVAASDLLAKKADAGGAPRTVAVGRMTVSGMPKIGDFKWGEKVSARFDYDQRAAEAAWGYDDDNLYLCFRNVRDETPMINNGKNPQALFKTGDAVVFELRTTPENGSPQVIAGDLRLLISVFEDNPTAVLYRYIVPGTSQPQKFTLGVTVTTIDRIQALGDARVEINRRADAYDLTASVPLSALDFRPEKGSYRGDFGVIYSDRLGRTNELRMYWSNQATGMIADLTIEAQIEPRHWGRFDVQ